MFKVHSYHANQNLKTKESGSFKIYIYIEI